MKPHLGDYGFKTNNSTEIAVNKTPISGGRGYKNTAYMSVFMGSIQKNTVWSVMLSVALENDM
jgi:hypothetical protein